MKIAAVLLLVTVALYAAGRLVANHFGVGDRWLETGGDYTSEQLGKWIHADQVRAARYAFPVLVPVDLLLLVFLGATLAVASVTWAGSVRGLTTVAWLAVVLPTVFVGLDLAEDALLVRLLTAPEAVTRGTVSVVRAITTAKIWSLKLALAQTVALAVAALVFRR